MSEQTAPGQAATPGDPIPEIFVRWLSTSYATGHVPTTYDITSEWKRLAPARREFWRHRSAAVAAAAPARTAEGGCGDCAHPEVDHSFRGVPDACAWRTCKCPGCREPQPQAAPGPDAAMASPGADPGDVFSGRITELHREVTRYRSALENVFAVLDRQINTYAERISYARTLIRTALEGK